MFQPLVSKKLVSDFFETKNSLGLWTTYVDGWFKKVSSITEYYLLIIVRDKITNACSIGAFKVDKNVKLNYNVTECKFNSKTMVIDSLADPELLDIKIYDTKTRMEIKVKEKFYNDPNYCYQIYDFDQLGQCAAKEKINE